MQPPLSTAPRISPYPVPADPLSVWMVASEAVPFVKTGGLADVVTALSRALGRLGHRVTIVLPQYRHVARGRPRGRVVVTMGGRRFDVRLSRHEIDARVQALLVDCPELFDREAPYGIGSADFPDNPVRFAVLARAALEAVGLSGDRPSVLHAHDWQAGLVPVYQRTRYRTAPQVYAAATVFTIHNLSYQGSFAPEWMPALDLGWDLYTPAAVEYWGRGSFLKAGIVFSDAISTVSRRYAWEIQTPAGGIGFDGILVSRSADLVGITNGIDTHVWDPARDPHLPQPYDAADLAGKAVAKRAVLEAFGLPVTEETLTRALVGMISRLIDQKGFDLLAAAADFIPRLDATFVLLGSGERRYEDLWRDLAGRFPDRIGARIGFDERLAHLIEAGSDIFLMPSRFEPCGLNQMYSLRYGTVPVVRTVGGLDDTVVDYTGPGSGGTGFKFAEYAPGALLGALARALEVHRRPAEWRALQARGMAQDFSWDAAALEYVQLYVKAIGSASPRAAPVG